MPSSALSAGGQYEPKMLSRSTSVQVPKSQVQGPGAVDHRASSEREQMQNVMARLKTLTNHFEGLKVLLPLLLEPYLAIY